MHNELRYQAKRHTISKKLSKEKIKIPHLLPQFLFYFFIFFNVENNRQKNNKHMLMEKEKASSPNM
jgi:hypothetical protein